MGVIGRFFRLQTDHGLVSDCGSNSVPGRYFDGLQARSSSEHPGALDKSTRFPCDSSRRSIQSSGRVLNRPVIGRSSRTNIHSRVLQEVGAGFALIAPAEILEFRLPSQQPRSCKIGGPRPATGRNSGRQIRWMRLPHNLRRRGCRKCQACSSPVSSLPSSILRLAKSGLMVFMGEVTAL